MKTMTEPKRPRGRPRTVGPSTQLWVRVPLDVYAKLAGEAAASGKTESELAREVLAEHFAAAAASKLAKKREA